MSKIAYAFDKATSPIKRVPNANVTVHPETEYMALCQFSNIYWEYDRHRNYMPILKFEGEVERLDAIKSKFPHELDTVYFGENKPKVTYAYTFGDNQLAELAKKGFWSEDGVKISEKLTTAKFQLETKVIIEEMTDTYAKDQIPTFNVSLVKPHENQFNSKSYSLAQFVSRKQKEEAKVIEVKGLEQEMGINELVEKSKELLEAERQAAQQASYVPKTPEEVAVDRASASIANTVSNVRDEIQTRRDANNARVEAERAAEEARIKAEQEKMATIEDKKDKNEVEFKETADTKADDVRNLVGGVEENKYDDNSSIFNDAEETDEVLPDNVIELMKKLGGGQTENEAVDDSENKKLKTDDSSGTTSGTQNKLVYTFENNENEVKQTDEQTKTDEKKSDKPDDNNNSSNGSNSDNNSGAASGAQGLGVYTFEDRDTAQYEARSDVNGSETEEDKKEKNEKERDEQRADAANDVKVDKAAENEAKLRKARLDNTINDTTVKTVSTDKSDRSR